MQRLAIGLTVISFRYLARDVKALKYHAHLAQEFKISACTVHIAYPLL